MGLVRRSMKIVSCNIWGISWDFKLRSVRILVAQVTGVINISRIKDGSC